MTRLPLENLNGINNIVPDFTKILYTMTCGHPCTLSLHAANWLRSVFILYSASDCCVIIYIHSYFLCNSNFIILCKWICVFLPSKDLPSPFLLIRLTLSYNPNLLEVGCTVIHSKELSNFIISENFNYLKYLINELAFINGLKNWVLLFVLWSWRKLIN